MMFRAVSYTHLDVYKRQTLKSFKESILSIHERIMGNREAHFEIKTTKNQSVVDFIMRTEDDGSHCLLYTSRCV